MAFGLCLPKFLIESFAQFCRYGHLPLNVFHSSLLYCFGISSILYLRVSGLTQPQTALNNNNNFCSSGFISSSSHVYLSSQFHVPFIVIYSASAYGSFEKASNSNLFPMFWYCYWQIRNNIKTFVVGV